MAQQNIYDNDTFYESFKGLRSDEINFNDVIETPIITKMLPDLKGKKLLDIGCGMGQHAMQYSKAGAESVLGTDISEKMLAFAVENNSAECTSAGAQRRGPVHGVHCFRQTHFLHKITIK